jgi:hypothetical protein
MTTLGKYIKKEWNANKKVLEMVILKKMKIKAPQTQVIPFRILWNWLRTMKRRQAMEEQITKEENKKRRYFIQELKPNEFPTKTIFK